MSLNSLVGRLRDLGLSEAEARLWLSVWKREDFAHQFFHDRLGRPWRVRDYQRASLESRALRKVHCDGRDVGKTTEIEIIACWAMACCPHSEMLVATQTENHLYPLMERLARRFQTTPALASALVEIKRTPSWHLRFANGFVLWGRIAGLRGVNFQGMHVDWQIVDEAQAMTDSAWTELFQSLNAGGRRWVYGVPNGVRNMFYRLTQASDAEQYHWPSYMNPEFTAEKDAELAALYGGRHTPAYRHQVLGEFGEPRYAVFYADDYLACVDSGLIAPTLLLRNQETLTLPFTPQKGDYVLGADFGYSQDPSEFVVFQDKDETLTCVLRVHLEHVGYAEQQACLLELDHAFHFKALGFDSGGSGRAVAHCLTAAQPDLEPRLHIFDFGSTLTLPAPHGNSPLRRRTKEFMTELLQRRLRARTIRFPHCPEREAQYLSHTYHTTPQGYITYDKGNDHVLDADRCAILAHYLALESIAGLSRPSLPHLYGF